MFTRGGAGLAAQTGPDRKTFRTRVLLARRDPRAFLMVSVPMTDEATRRVKQGGFRDGPSQPICFAWWFAELATVTATATATTTATATATAGIYRVHTSSRPRAERHGWLERQQASSPVRAYTGD